MSASIARSPDQRASTATGRMQPVTTSAPVSPSAETRNGIASEPSANASENTASVRASTRASVWSGTRRCSSVNPVTSTSELAAPTTTNAPTAA
jgi:hypothetical protein